MLRQSISISLLLITLILPVMWQTYDHALMWEKFKMHPWREIEYEPIVYISTLFDRIKPAVYLLAITIYSPLGKTKLIRVYILYELMLIVDFILTYDQFPFRRYAIVVLGIWTSIYYFKNMYDGKV